MEDSDGDSDYDPRYYVLSNSLYYKHGLFINIIQLGHYCRFLIHLCLPVHGS